MSRFWLNSYISSLAAIACLIVIGCSGELTPGRLDFTGEILEKQDTEGDMVLISVSASATLDTDTIWIHTNNLIDFDSLAVGSKIQVWIAGPGEIMESNPPQAIATRIQIVSD